MASRSSPLTTAERVRENRLRLMATRQGLTVRRARRRDRKALDYGTYSLLRASTGEVLRAGLTMDGLEEYLTN